MDILLIGVGRARARARLEDRRQLRCATGSSSRRAIPARRNAGPTSPSIPATTPRSSPSAGRRRSISSWSAPRRRWWPASSTILRAAGIKAFGPRRAAAQLEGSKAFTKELCAEFGIPTAAFARFREADAAKAYVRERGAPIVVKADGLAAGKGVVVAASVAEAEAAIDAMLGGSLGAAAPSSSSKNASSARRRASSPCATARPPSRSARRRTTSAPSTATGARTPAAWAPIRPRRC